MTTEEKDYYLYGIVVGLGAASGIVAQSSNLAVIQSKIAAELSRLNRARDRLNGVPMKVDGEAEWQSWLIEMELQSWKNAA